MTDTREVAGLALKVARADAIHRYVSVEQSLCSLLAKMLSIPDNEAGIIFFNIVAANSRDKIMERLIEKRLAPEYWPFFNGIRGVPGILPACLLFFSSSPLPETNRSLGRRGERRRWAGHRVTSAAQYIGISRRQAVTHGRRHGGVGAKADFVSRILTMFNVVVLAANDFPGRET
jgi:hypothetical protein